MELGVSPLWLFPFQAMLPHFPGASVALTTVLCFIKPVRLSVYYWILDILFGINQGLPWVAKHKTRKPIQVPLLFSEWPLLPSVTSACLGYSLMPSRRRFFVFCPAYTVVFYGRVVLMWATLPLAEPRPRGAYIKMQCQMTFPEDTDSVAQGLTLSEELQITLLWETLFHSILESFSLCSNTSFRIDSFLFIMYTFRKI